MESLVLKPELDQFEYITSLLPNSLKSKKWVQTQGLELGFGLGLGLVFIHVSGVFKEQRNSQGDP